MPDRYQSEFAEALKTGDVAGLSDYLEDPTQLSRFAVYRNNVVRASIDVLKAAYPSVLRLVGENFFATMARAYWEVNPPKVPSLTFYGGGFADHIAAYSPADALVYLPDVARLDRAWLEAHHAIDEAVLAPDQIGAMHPQDLPRLALSLVQSASLQTSDWPAYAIWRTNRYDAEPRNIDLVSTADACLIWRSRGEVQHHGLTPGSAAFFAHLMGGATLETASEAGGRTEPDFVPAAAFGFGLSHGIFSK
jgi:hypothetical protein